MVIVIGEVRGHERATARRDTNSEWVGPKRTVARIDEQIFGLGRPAAREFGLDAAADCPAYACGRGFRGRYGNGIATEYTGDAHKRRTACDVKERGAGEIAGAHARRSIPIGFRAGSNDVVIFLEVAIDAHETEVAFDADKPGWRDCPIVACREADGEFVVIYIAVARARSCGIARSRGIEPDLAKCTAGIAADIKSVPGIAHGRRRLDRHFRRHVRCECSRVKSQNRDSGQQRYVQTDHLCPQ